MRHDLEFVFRPETQAIFDHFRGVLGIRIAFFSSAGEELRVGEGSSTCVYCRLLRRNLGLEDTCIELDAARRAEAARSGALTLYTCHGGMLEAVMPVHVSGRLLGFAMIGQFRQRTKPPSGILKRANAILGGRLRRSYLQVPHFTPSEVRHVAGLFETLMRYICENRFIDREDAIGPILTRLRENPESRLPLRHAAALAGCSPSAFSRMFRKMAGRSYQRMRIQLLLEKADALLRSKPGIRVQEVAFQLGFDDPLYFSRLYRKHRGVSPKLAARRGLVHHVQESIDPK